MYTLLFIIIIFLFIFDLISIFLIHRAYQNYVQLLNEIKMLKSIIDWKDNYDNKK